MSVDERIAKLREEWQFGNGPGYREALAIIDDLVRQRDEQAKELERLKSQGACDHRFESDPGMYDTLHRYCTKCGRAE